MLGYYESLDESGESSAPWIVSSFFFPEVASMHLDSLFLPEHNGFGESL